MHDTDVLVTVDTRAHDVVTVIRVVLQLIYVIIEQVVAS